MLSLAAKWLGDTKTKVHCLCDYPSYKKNKRDDRALLRTTAAYLDEADVVIAHNGDNFDLKKINARLLINNIPNPSPYKTIDTLKICRRHFKFESNKLDNVAQHLGVGRKLPTQGKDTWLGCMDGDPKSWGVMREYNRHDVEPLLEGVYYKLRPWATTHPDLSRYSGNGCPRCQSTHIQSRGPDKYKPGYQRLRCMGCGHWHSKKK